ATPIAFGDAGCLAPRIPSPRGRAKPPHPTKTSAACCQSNGADAARELFLEAEFTRVETDRRPRSRTIEVMAGNSFQCARVFSFVHKPQPKESHETHPPLSKPTALSQELQTGSQRPIPPEHRHAARLSAGADRSRFEPAIAFQERTMNSNGPAP